MSSDLLKFESRCTLLQLTGKMIIKLASSRGSVWTVRCTVVLPYDGLDEHFIVILDLHAEQVEEDGCYSSQVGHGLAGLSVLDRDTVQLVLKVLHSQHCDDLN